ncbi:acyltransferase [Ancylobacter sp. A5.8]|uniref:acyltransferase family protein n=1 Tax=Ancylobacter gelatini TaxID=2919920 RepID=UPI001F4DC22A|nr:acyltransferase family protein [Ancylobacter gelatini]MCJ8144623.1 acyltransferase [Ancylobacter gelatini]
MKYRAEIDGLRALAVLPVILFHAKFDLFSGGFVGVDIFFVISGFLITTVIYQETLANRFSIVKFYERRIRRIFPALYALVLACIPAAWLLMTAPEFKDFWQSVIATILSVSNILFWRESGYFAAAAEMKPLLHTWSLGVEEQFYIIFPILILLVGKLSPRNLTAVLVILSALSLGLAEWMAPRYPDANFFLLPTRAWELGLGAALAITAERWNRPASWRSEAGALLGLGGIVYSIFAFDESIAWPSAWTLIPVVGVLLVIALARQDTIAGRLLSWKPFIAIGLISYSAYLWHQPLFVFARMYFMEQVSTNIYLALCAVTFVMAALSWRFIEQPFRKPGEVTRRVLFSSAALASLVFIAVGVAGYYFSPSAQARLRYLNDDQLNALRIVEAVADRAKSPYGRSGDCRLQIDGISPASAATIADCRRRYGPGIAVLGDSHSMNTYRALIKTTDKPFVVGIARGYCRPNIPSANCHYDGFLDFVKGSPDAFALVIYNQAGFYLMLDDTGDVTDRADLLDRNNHEEFAVDTTGVNAVADYLAKIDAYTPVIWLGPWIEPYLAMRELVARGCSNPPEGVRPNLTASFDKLDDDIARQMAARGDIDYISTIKDLNFDAKTDIINCKDVYFNDGDHWSAAGEERFGNRLSTLRAAIAERQ